MPTATTKTLQVLCPHCMNADEAVKLDLNNLNEIECGCGETFTAAEAARVFADQAERWVAVACWIKSAPTP